MGEVQAVRLKLRRRSCCTCRVLRNHFLGLPAGPETELFPTRIGISGQFFCELIRILLDKSKRRRILSVWLLWFVVCLSVFHAFLFVRDFENVAYRLSPQRIPSEWNVFIFLLTDMLCCCCLSVCLLCFSNLWETLKMLPFAYRLSPQCTPSERNIFIFLLTAMLCCLSVCLPTGYAFSFVRDFYDYRVACVIASLSLAMGPWVYDYRMACAEPDSGLQSLWLQSSSMCDS